MQLPFTRQTLGNGLTVIVHEDHRCPIVGVNLWYHVGSRNERPGRTGFAHLFEHLMFEGSAHHDRDFFFPLQQAGALLNGSTNADRTNYWEVVPAGTLELALWLESDRMGYLLPALTEAKFATQRDVVLNERRQNYENRPYGLAPMAMLATLYPPDHPYHWTTIGEPDDLRAATLDEARAFFARFYHPRNASLTIAGAVATAAAIDLAERYFGAIPAGPSVDRDVVTPEPVPARIVFEDRVELPRLYMAWHSPSMFGPGDADLDLAADIIAGGKSSRLYRSLVYERRVATDVTAVQNSRELSSFFQIAATAAPGQSLADLALAIAEEVASLSADGPKPDELERSQAQAEAHFVYRLQHVGGFGGKADQLNAYVTFVGDPDFFDRDLARYLRATPRGVRDVVRQYLGAVSPVVLSIVPTGRFDLAVPDSRPVRPA